MTPKLKSNFSLIKTANWFDFNRSGNKMSLCSSDSECDDPDQQITKKLKTDSPTATALIELPFETKRLAEIAYNSLSVDKGPKGEIKELWVEESKLFARFKAADARSLRISVNSFLDFTNLVAKTIERFDDA